MPNPPLQPLHLNSALSQAKLNHYARLTTEELIRSLLGLEDETRLVDGAGLRLISFPINDYDVPSSEGALRQLVRAVEEFLEQGCVVGIHCRAGVGRSSLVAACLLVNNGEDSESSFEKISVARGVLVPDTLAQRQWVGEFARPSQISGQ